VEVPTREKGTRILISDLKEPEIWKGEAAANQLRDGLSQLLSPYKGIADFRVYASVNGRRIELAEIGDAVRHTAQVHYDLVFDGQQLTVAGKARLTFFRPPGGKMRRRFREVVELDGGLQFRDYLKQLPAAGDFNLLAASEAGWFVQFSQGFLLSSLDKKALLEGGQVASPGPFSGEIDGFNLGAIRRLLEGVGDSSSEVLGFARAVRAPFEEEEPEILEAEEIAKRWGGEGDPALLRRAERLGLLRPLGEGRFEVASPRVMRAGTELAELGIPPQTALEVAAKLRRQSREVARVFIELFLENIWKPFERAGRPEEEWPRVREALERLRPLASESLLAIFGLVMTEATEKAFGRALERDLSRDSHRRRSRRRTTRGQRR